MSSGELDLSDPETAKKVVEIKKNIGKTLGFLDGIFGGISKNTNKNVNNNNKRLL